MSAVASLDAFLEKVAQRDGHQPEFLQAVREVFTSIWPFLETNPKYRSEALLELKNVKRGRVEEFAKQFGLQYFAGKRPWEVKADIALPCATQNELEISDAKALIANGVKLVAEGANMPTTIEATEAFLEAGVLFGPGKAANAGGVATSGLEMAQSSQRLYWTAEEVDKQLHRIMLDIHANCKKYGSAEGQANINYVVGANVAGFVKVADAMLAQGVY